MRKSNKMLIKMLSLLLVIVMVVAVLYGCKKSSSSSESEKEKSEETIKVGILHSLSGTMSISEVSLKDAELMAIEEINNNGGVLGKKLEPIVEDGASDWPTFAEKAKKLLQKDKVAVIFGCWTSASRKAVLPVVEENNGLLFYPVQYEGLESSPNIFYMGAAPNQQIVPAVKWLFDNGKKDFICWVQIMFFHVQQIRLLRLI